MSKALIPKLVPALEDVLHDIDFRTEILCRTRLATQFVKGHGTGSAIVVCVQVQGILTFQYEIIHYASGGFNPETSYRVIPNVKPLGELAVIVHYPDDG